MENGKWCMAACLAVAVSLASCGQHAPSGGQQTEEDHAAREMLQGVWIDEDANDVAFRVKGDTVYYPDSVSVPVRFRVSGDTLVLMGSKEVKYPIVKLSAHLLEFKTQSGDVLKLSKTSDRSYLEPFLGHREAVALNQGKVIKRDTVATCGSDRYHAYVQVNPTTYKVLKSSYNEDGVAVDNVYYDNIVNVTVYRGAVRLFSHDFRKQDFAGRVPETFLGQAILSDIEFGSADNKGMHFVAVIAVPDSPTSYREDFSVTLGGKLVR